MQLSPYMDDQAGKSNVLLAQQTTKCFASGCNCRDCPNGVVSFSQMCENFWYPTFSWSATEIVAFKRLCRGY